METDFLQTFFDLVIQFIVTTLETQFSEIFTFLELLQSLGLFV